MIFIQQLRTNDISPDSGKQYELGKAFMAKFGWDNENSEDVRNVVLNMPDKVVIRTAFKVRGNERGGSRSGVDCKEYADAHGNFPLKDYLRRKFSSKHVKNVCLVYELVNDNEFNVEFTPLVTQIEVEDFNDSIINNEENLPLQQIFYGAPGTGKSHTINEITNGESVVRTTFHPDSDYSTFVGAYKPTTKEVALRDVSGHKILEGDKEITENRIVYEFVDQAFLQAYVQAWKFYTENSQSPKNQYLIIEEINRGNCAQIFGDLFQLLDRNQEGFSSYEIKPDTDIKNFINKQNLGVSEIYDVSGEFDISEKINNGDLLALPPNLFIWATMNTSDQSLFPMDSAFKRRWEWVYVPIEQPEIGKDARKWKIKADDHWCYWWEFLQAINQKIEDVVNSEDKQLGYFFTKPTDGEFIDANTFVNKVIFYLWNDVFKDEECDCFVYKKSGDDWDVDDIILNDNTKLTFRKFISSRDKVDEKLVHWFINNLLKSEKIEKLDDDKQEVVNPGDIACMRP